MELLKLKAPPILDDWGNVLAVSKIQVGEEWHSNSWEHLTKLQALSMEPSLLAVGKKNLHAIELHQILSNFGLS